MRIANPGKVAYFAPTWGVTAVSGNTLTTSFGAVKNVDSVDTTVDVEITFATSPNSTLGSHTLSGIQTIGGVSIGAMSLTIIDNVSTYMTKLLL